LSNLHRHRPHVESIRLERWHRFAMYGVCVVLAASGILWLVFHHFVHYKGAFGEAPHPLTVWWLKLHGAAAMLALICAGSLILTHMRRAWRSRRNRGSGGSLAVISIILTGTGYLLYYAADENLRAAASLVHWTVGIACVGIFPGHVWLGRRRSRRHRAESVCEEQMASTRSQNAYVSARQAPPI